MRMQIARKWMFALFLFGFTMVSAATAQSKNVAQTLDHGWRFRQLESASTSTAKGAPKWLPASVPGDVHLDLLANHEIEDPFFRDNESKLQWIEKVGWEYELNFVPTAAVLSRAHVDMVFDGLDGACDVWLNGEKILAADNSFRTWRVAVNGRLKTGRNQLRVVFPSPIEAAAKVAATDPWRAKTKTDEKTYIRKPAYEYGWDWGPRFVTSGIWKPVRLEAWNQARIADFAIHQKDVSREVAHLEAEVEIESEIDGAARVQVGYWGVGDPIAGLPSFVFKNVLLHKGKNSIVLPLELRKPKLWFPAGYGEQSRYDFTLGVSVKGQAIEGRAVRTGLRSIVLRRDLDQWGRSFEFVVNGIPVFAKGADVIPFDSFANRVKTADYRRILTSAREANMNMIRHWGGGYYESDEFYDLCDELGLMVWQDFMFGNDWQPATESFKKNIEAEAEDQVRRLRHHPSIVIWCGNNETEMAVNWTPRWSLPQEVKTQMWKDYLSEFSGILPRVVARLEPEIPYWPSSPSANYEPVSDTFHSGDTHDWTVWHSRAPFADYEKRHWRFVTEFGFQSFPEWRTVESFTREEDRTGIFTPVMLAHQKNAEGNAIIHDYLLKDYPEPKDFASFLYVSQVLQAEGIKVGAEHFRRNRPETMGSIFWQLNDCWPVASWSSIDSVGRWKALQHYARRFYAPLLVSPHVEGGAVKVYVVSDAVKTEKAALRLRLMDFDGKVLLEENKPVEVDPLASKVYMEWPLKKIADAGATDTTRVFVVAELMEEGRALSRNLLYLAPVKEVHLPLAALQTELRKRKNEYVLRVTSLVLARDVFLSFGELDAQVGENYFDLLPGESMEVTVQSSARLAQLQKELKVISLVDAFPVAAQQATTISAKH